MAQEADVYAALTGIFRDLFMRDDLTLTPLTAAADVNGWDSYKHIEIILALEETYGFQFNARELDSLQNVGDLVRAVMAHAA